MDRPIPISEIFGPVIQGEGHLAGRPTLFIRTGGCDYRCSWCDTKYAVLPEYRKDWAPMEVSAIIGRIRQLAPPPILVTISGGNPALHDLSYLVAALEIGGYETAMETQGSIARWWYAALRHLVISPKGPSAKTLRVSKASLDACIEAARGATVLKVVVFDEDDYIYALGVHTLFPRVPFYLSVGTDLPGTHAGQPILPRMAWLMDRVANDRAMRDARVLPQLHALAYGGQRGK